jgi:hypothetical protein
VSAQQEGRRRNVSSDAAASHGVGQLVIRIPAYRTAGQSKRARSGVSRIPSRNAGDARKYHGIAPRGVFQNSRLLAASSVAFVPGVPQLGLPARPHGAGLAQGGGLRGVAGGRLNGHRASRASALSAMRQRVAGARGVLATHGVVLFCLRAVEGFAACVCRRHVVGGPLDAWCSLMLPAFPRPRCAPGSIPASPRPLPSDHRLGRKSIVTQKIIDSSRHTGLIEAVAALQLHSNRLWHARFSSTGFYPACSATMRKHVNELLQAEHAG